MVKSKEQKKNKQEKVKVKKENQQSKEQDTSLEQQAQSTEGTQLNDQEGDLERTVEKEPTIKPDEVKTYQPSEESYLSGYEKQDEGKQETRTPRNRAEYIPQTQEQRFLEQTEEQTRMHTQQEEGGYMGSHQAEKRAHAYMQSR